MKKDNESTEVAGAPDEAEYPIHSVRHALHSMSKAHAMKMPKAQRMALHARVKKRYPFMDMPIQGQFPEPAPVPMS